MLSSKSQAGIREVLAKALFLLGIAAIVSWPQDLNAGLFISPANVELKLSQGRASGQFTISNNGEEEERYRAKAVHFIIAKDGVLKKIPEDDYSLAGWIKFNPTEFTLPPKSSRLVRFSVIPKQKIKAREYWGAIEFVPLEVQSYKPKNATERSVNLRILTVILVPVYGLVNGTQYSGKIKKIEATKQKNGKLQISCEVANTGEGILQLSGNCSIVDLSGKVIEEITLKHLLVFPKQERIEKLVSQKPLIPGDYLVRFKLKSALAHAKVELSETAKINYPETK